MERKKYNRDYSWHSSEGVGEYVDGNTVRKLEAAPRIEPQVENDYDLDEKRKERMRKIQRRREKAKQMDLFSIGWFIFAVGVTFCVCVFYLKLQSELTNTQKEVTAIENEILVLQEENKTETANLTANIDLDYIYKVATEKYGMVYPEKGQVVPYKSTKNNSVSQYGEIPNGMDGNIISKIFGK